MKPLETLDARPDRLDLRDLPYRPRLVNLPPQYPEERDVEQYLGAYIKDGMILDQGEEGACTGYGLACVINYLLWKQWMLGERSGTAVTRVSECMLYDLARFYDEWPGEDYEGSSCRGAVKAWHKHGVCAHELWPPRRASARPRARKGRKKAPRKPTVGDWADDAASRPLGVYYRIEKNSVVDIQAALLEVGAVYVSAEVHDGWDLEPAPGVPAHASLPQIRPPRKPDETSGHAFAFVGYNRRGFIVQNSWGKKWGCSGFAVLPYDDWVERAMDAWVAVLGAPTAGKRERSPRVFVPGSATYAEQTDGRPVQFLGFGGKQKELPQRPPEVARWDRERAYLRTVVAGNNGHIINRIVSCRDGADAVRFVVREQALQYFQARGGKRRILLYGHGGLNDEQDSLDRIRSMGPWFEENGVYPVFLTWKTGAWESIRGILADKVFSIFGKSEGVLDALRELKDRAMEKLDRSIEVIAENAGVKSIWSEMKQNAADSILAGRLGDQVLKELRALVKDSNQRVEVHLVGHSAGSIVLGEWLRAEARRAAASRLSLASATLYAPACTVDFANDTWARAVERGMLAKKDLYVHLLSDDRELDDTVGPYQKSLLYLVSRALEVFHKTPLLGLAHAFLTDPATAKLWHEETRAAVKAWQAFWGAPGKNLDVVDRKSVRDSTDSHVSVAHGSFDNDIDTVGKTLSRILGGAPRHPITDLRY